MSYVAMVPFFAYYEPIPFLCTIRIFENGFEQSEERGQLGEMTVNTHIFFCNNSDCEHEVEMIGMACEDHESDTTSECPGCGMDLYVGANGYCAYCWVDRFGSEEEDYDRRNCECRQSPLCEACVRYFGYDDDDEYDGHTYNCTNCRRDFKNRYWRNQFLCRDCEG